MRVLRTLALLYIAWCGVLFFLQDGMLFPRHAAPSPLPSPPFAGTQVIRIDVADGGPMEGWFVPSPTPDASSPGPVVIFCHGNAEIIDGQDWFVENYLRMGCSVFLPEYRGYGRSPGRPSEKAIVEDCVRFYDELIKRRMLIRPGSPFTAGRWAGAWPHRSPRDASRRP